jgi:hypothetical protein
MAQFKSNASTGVGAGIAGPVAPVLNLAVSELSRLLGNADSPKQYLTVGPQGSVAISVRCDKCPATAITQPVALGAIHREDRALALQRNGVRQPSRRRNYRSDGDDGYPNAHVGMFRQFCAVDEPPYPELLYVGSGA